MKKYKKRRANIYKRICPFDQREFECNNSGRKFCPDSNCKDCFWNAVKKEIYHRNKELVQTAERNTDALDVLFNKGYFEVTPVDLRRVQFKFAAYKDHLVTPEQASQGFGDIYVYNVYGLKNLDHERRFEIVKL